MGTEIKTLNFYRAVTHIICNINNLVLYPPDLDNSFVDL